MRIALFTTALVLVTSPASAHVALEQSTPAAKASIRSPSVIDLKFSGKIEPRFSGFDVLKADGTKAALTPLPAAKDGRGVSAKLSHPLVPGPYRVAWHIVSTDGHRMTGSYDFNVR